MKMFDRLVLHPRSRVLCEKLAGHLPHGLIIDGPNGIGALTVARAIAKEIGSPELIIYPKKKVRGESVIDHDEGSVLIEDIRLLYEQARSRQPNTHVYIIDTGRKTMTHGAQNAFLKLLEEPRAKLHFIIVTHQYDQLLPTITSRCQRLSLLPITDKQTNALVDSFRIHDEQKRLRLTFVGKGLPALLTRLASEQELYDARAAIMMDAKAMLGSNYSEKIAIIHKYRDNRANALILIDDINHQLQTIVKSQPEQRIVSDIERNLETRRRIAAGGNIRLQLTCGVL